MSISDKLRAAFQLNLVSQQNNSSNLIGASSILISEASSLVSSQVSSIPCILDLSRDNNTSSTIYIHHIWISSTFLMIRIILLTSTIITLTNSSSSLLDTLVNHKSSYISGISWISLYLGFHSLSIYIHNDSSVGFGLSAKQIALEPVFSGIIQTVVGKQSIGLINT